MKEWQRYISVENIVHLSFIKFVSQAYNKPYSMMASLSAMSPSTMRWMMLLCSSSDRFLWDTSGVLYLVAGDGSTPWSHAWLSISSSDARLFGSLWSIRFIRLWKTEREDDEDAHQKILEHVSSRHYLKPQDCVILCWKPRISSGLSKYLSEEKNAPWYSCYY